MLHGVAVVHRLVRAEPHDHRLGPDGQRPGERVVVLDGGLQVHQPLAGLVVGLVQLLAVAHPRDPDPGAAVVGLHEQRVADPGGDLVQVERLVVAGRGVGVAGVVHRVLRGHQHGLGNLEPEPDHRAVGGVLLHRLERERIVHEIDVVHERGLLDPFARVVVPVSKAVDDERVARPHPQVEGLYRDPLGGEGVRLPLERHPAPGPADDGLECAGPVLFRAEEQPDQVGSHVTPTVLPSARVSRGPRYSQLT